MLNNRSNFTNKIFSNEPNQIHKKVKKQKAYLINILNHSYGALFTSSLDMQFTDKLVNNLQKKFIHVHKQVKPGFTNYLPRGLPKKIESF